MALCGYRNYVRHPRRTNLMSVASTAILLVILPVSVTLAEASAPVSYEAMTLKLNGGYLRGYASHTKSILTSPSSWRFSGWLKASLILGVTAVLADDEEDVQAWLQDKRSTDTDRVARWVKPLGNGRYTLPALGALYCYGRLRGSERAARTALLGLESFAITGLFTETIKHVSHKHRPMSGDFETVMWDGPSASGANLSFPSGHAASAFAIATVVASEYEDNLVVPPLVYGAAGLCAYSRLNDNAHWLTDVILGAAIGYFTAKAVVGLHGSGTHGRLSLSPVVNDRYAGLSLCRSF